MKRETVQVVEDSPIQVTKGSAGLKSQIPGSSVTVSSFSASTGGIGKGKIMECDSK